MCVREIDRNFWAQLRTKANDMHVHMVQCNESYQHSVQIDCVHVHVYELTHCQYIETQVL